MCRPCNKCSKCLSTTVLTFDVGTETATDASITFTTTTQEKSLCMGTMWMVEHSGYTLPMATTRGGF